MATDKKKIGYIVLENARIMFRNFSGRATKYSPRGGIRTFCVIIDDPLKAQGYSDDGWNVRILPPRDENEEPKYYLQVQARFDNIPPKIYLVKQKGGGSLTQLTEDTVECLDYAEILNVDLRINPSVWEVNGKSGIKAYLKEMYVTIEEDEFADKYAEFED